MGPCAARPLAPPRGARQADPGCPSSPTPEPPPLRLRAELALVAAGAGVGIAASAAAYAFTVLAHEAEAFVWHTVPGWWGAEEAPWWWVLALLAIGGAAVAAAIRLPGHGGHHPLDPLSFDIRPSALPSTLLAALATLAAGAVVGPEAPLMAIGTAIAFAVARGALEGVAPVLAMCGAAAALGVVIGNPMITAILILEGAVISARVAHRRTVVLVHLLPVLAALGAGYLIRVGVGTWTGVSSHPLELGEIAPYPTLLVRDLLPTVAVAVVTALLLTMTTRAAGQLRRRLPPRLATAGLVVGGLVVGGIALVVRAATGEPLSTVLFSGQNDLGTVLAITSAGALLLVALGKTLAYGVSLGVGFRGGAIFPAITVGVALATAAHAVMPGTSVAPLAAAGVGAAVGAVLGLPFTSALFGLLLLSPSGEAVTVAAALGAVAGVLAEAWVDDRLRVQPEDEVQAPQH
ncbi:chloride channel protein [Actinotalea sp. M2MS4P-6]|uniref:chloride channel protein n=1 Tax=Actinotalea sp. M2MS4P-6 TaxID=2983762 RepID=UPI0021E3736E|nr:chloride channel protein [Actinotalea sp. M2MS4P-6]MCV2395470.1 chloride channel protein [Actinotalea sp. M2MS4P-6]